MLIEGDAHENSKIHQIIMGQDEFQAELTIIDSLQTIYSTVMYQNYDLILFSLDNSFGNSSEILEWILENQFLPLIVLAHPINRDLGIHFIQKGAQNFLIKGSFTHEAFIHSIMFAYERFNLEKQTRSSLKEKELYLKEIHHRVKNNMQIIASLLQLQSKYMSHEHIMDILLQSQNRIKVMLMIHEKLLLSNNLKTIDFQDYANDLLRTIFMSFGIDSKRIKFTVKARNIFLNSEYAVPCGLIINELISNSLKHGFNKQKKGRIYLHVIKKDAHIQMNIGDDGCGIPEETFNKNNSSFGLQLVKILIMNQLKGTCKINSQNGTHYQIEFSLSSLPNDGKAQMEY